MLNRLLILLIAAMGAYAQAEPISVYQIDMTQSATADAPDQNIYLQVFLGHEIYKYAQDAQLSGLRVLDAKGNLLPFALAKPEAESQTKIQDFNLAFFQIPKGATTADLQKLSLDKLTLDAHSLQLEFAQSQSQANHEVQAGFYLVDLNGVTQAIDELQFDWLSSSQNHLVPVTVSASNSLQDWQFLATSTLSRLHNSSESNQDTGKQLFLDKIQLKLAARDFRFLRIDFADAPEEFVLKGIKAIAHQNLSMMNFTETWEQAGELADDQQSALRAASTLRGEPVTAWEYEREDIAGATQISVNLSQYIYGDKLRIFSKANRNQPWHLLYDGNWFNAQLGEAWQHSAAIDCYANSDTYWRIELAEATAGQVQPKLVFSRLQDRLRFIANAQPPFRVVLDSEANGPSQSTSAQILAQLTQGKHIEWQNRALAPLLDANQPAQRHVNNFSWRTWGFWSALCAAVIALLWMVLRLLGQMRKARQQETQ